MADFTDKPVFTVREIAKRTGVSRQTITRMFEREPGVLIVHSPETLHKRSYRSIRIPRAVAERVFKRIKTDDK